MARIRTIKPEFPQSETVGKLSRDARLLFVLLWTIVDDEGRARAASRMLASLLYPYDEDAPKLIDGWLAELEREGCIRRYVVDGSTYLEVTNWLKHQKIDKPTKSKLPEFAEGSRIVARPREASTTDLDLGKDLGEGPSSVPDGTGAEAPMLFEAHPSQVPSIQTPPQRTPEQQLFDRGREVLGKSSGGVVSKLLKAKGGSIPLARAALEQASTKSNAAEYLGAMIRAPKSNQPDHGMPDGII